MGSTGKSSLINQVTDNLDFNKWIKENLSNPEFKQFGKDNGMEGAHDLWRQKRAEAELKNVHEMSIEDAISTITDNVDPNTITGWFKNANSNYKPKLIEQILGNKGVLNAGLNVAYYNYKYDMAGKGKKPLDFKTWLVTPMELYRGTTGQTEIQSDIFTSYSADKVVAAKFTKSTSGSASVNKDLSDVDMSKIKTIKVFSGSS